MTRGPLYDLGRIAVVPGVDIDTRVPFVAVRAIESTDPRGGVAKAPAQAVVMHAQVSPEQARAIALELLVAAADAEADGAVVSMLSYDDSIRVVSPGQFVATMRAVRARMPGR